MTVVPRAPRNEHEAEPGYRDHVTPEACVCGDPECRRLVRCYLAPPKPSLQPPRSSQ